MKVKHEVVPYEIVWGGCEGEAQHLVICGNE